MTVAEAIERKNSISYEKNLLSRLKQQYMYAVEKVNAENNALEDKFKQYIQSMFGEKHNKTADEIAKYRTDYEAHYGWDLINPSKVEDLIKNMEKEILEFEANVDFVLSTSNSNTELEVELAD
jgi:hypothetical protein